MYAHYFLGLRISHFKLNLICSATPAWASYRTARHAAYGHHVSFSNLHAAARSGCQPTQMASTGFGLSTRRLMETFQDGQCSTRHVGTSQSNTAGSTNEMQSHCH